MMDKMVITVIIISALAVHLLHPVHSNKPELSAQHCKQTYKICPAGTMKKPIFQKEPRSWQSVRERSIIVYSAFYEERYIADGPSIRIIAAGLQKRFNHIGDIYCTLWYEDRDEPIMVAPAAYKAIYPNQSHADIWVTHFIICSLPHGDAPKVQGFPYAVSVTHESCSEPSNTLMVLNREPVSEQDKLDHVVCSAPLYNNFRNWTMVIEMFEMHKLLKVNAITIYVFSVAKETRETLTHYETNLDKNFEVTVLQWNFPSKYKSHLRSQRGAINDCYYRMRNKYKYISVIDMDEAIIPRMVTTLPELMLHISRDDYGAYLFQHAYFRRNYTIQAQQEHHLITQSSFWRTDVVEPAGKIRSKAMYHWDKAISLDLHFPNTLTFGSEEYIVKPEEGMLHHYRSHPIKPLTEHPERYNYIEDQYMEWMGKQLNTAVGNQINAIHDKRQQIHEEL